MINRFRRIFNKWGWTALSIIFIIVVLYFAITNIRLFRKSIIDNFNKQQFVLITALEAVVEDYIQEAEQNLRVVATEIDKVGNPQKSREFISTVYLNHKDDFLAIAIYNSTGKLIENVLKDAGQMRSIPGIQTEIINYSGNGNQPFISARYFYDNQNTVVLILPFTLSGGERYFTVGILRIEEFLKLHFSAWENDDVCIILANQDGNLLSMLNVKHDDVKVMSEGNIKSLDETCLSCHKPDDFADIIQSFKSGQNTSSVFYNPDGNISNRNTTPLSIYNAVWSWSVCTPYATIQRAIDRNFFYIMGHSLASVSVLGFIIFLVFRTQKKREILEVEAENLKKIAETSSALAKTEDKFRSLFEESLDAVFITSREGEFIELNQSGLELFGYTLEEIMSIELKEIYANPENHEAFQQMIEKQGFVKDYELDFLRRDGTRIKCILNASVKRDETGNINGYQGIIRDMTKKKESEYALRQASELDRKRVIEVQESYKNLQDSQNATMNLMEDLTREIEERKMVAEDLRSAQEYSKNLIDSSLDMIIAVDVKRRITEFNQAAVEAFGYQREEVLGKHINMLYADVKEGSKIHKITVKKGKHIQEISNKRKNGEVFPTLLAASTLRNTQGEIIGVMGVSRDISEQKVTEQALRESEEKFRGVIEQSNDGIYVLQNDRFVFVNPRYTEITGYQLEEISGEGFDFREMVAEEGLKVLAEREAKHKRGEDVPDRYIFKALRKDGQKRDMEVSVTTIDWQGKPATLGIVSDVTERIQNQMKLEEALHKAQEGERVKSLFLANMSHEIRTPLNAILGFTDLLATSTSHLISDEEKGFFDTIKSSGNRLMDTVHEILDISQIEAGTYDLRMIQLDLVALVNDLVNGVKPAAAKKGLKIKYTSEIDGAFIKADQYGISQAISNIIDNAIKYTEEGEITILLKKSSKQYVLTIQDTGIGISEEYLNNLFEIFSQESEGYTKKYQGIGLGMAIAKRHLDMNQVDMDVKSTKGVGTTFSLTFKPVKKKPLHKKKQIKQIESEDKPTAEAVDKSLILLVEDDPGSRKLVEFFLKEKYDLCFAVSVGEAKEQLKKYPVDLVLLDLSLVGNEDGLDLVKWMRKSKIWKKTPVIATTAHAFTTDQNNCITAGCNDYLSKPIKKNGLLEMISKYYSTNGS